MKQNDYHLSRRQMVERQLRSRNIKDEKVIEIMGRTPRHLFVQEALQSQAYGDHPLPIGEQQTISQPYIVAKMTEALELGKDDRVLEIGTGSGYQTIILAELCYRVYTIERHRPLLTNARNLLESMNYHNILYRVGDGSLGWKEEAPFDAIIIAAGAPKIPLPLAEQLATMGRMVIPVGPMRGVQTLLKIVKQRDGRLKQTKLCECRFVDLIGGHAWDEKSGGNGG